MNNEVHEKILGFLKEVDGETKELIIKAIELSERTTPETIANNLFRELNNIVKEG